MPRTKLRRISYLVLSLTAFLGPVPAAFGECTGDKCARQDSHATASNDEPKLAELSNRTTYSGEDVAAPTAPEIDLNRYSHDEPTQKAFEAAQEVLKKGIETLSPSDEHIQTAEKARKGIEAILQKQAKSPSENDEKFLEQDAKKLSEGLAKLEAILTAKKKNVASVGDQILQSLGPDGKTQTIVWKNVKSGDKIFFGDKTHEVTGMEHIVEIGGKKMGDAPPSAIFFKGEDGQTRAIDVSHRLYEAAGWKPNFAKGDSRSDLDSFGALVPTTFANGRFIASHQSEQAVTVARSNAGDPSIAPVVPAAPIVPPAVPEMPVPRANFEEAKGAPPVPELLPFPKVEASPPVPAERLSLSPWSGDAITKRFETGGVKVDVHHRALSVNGQVAEIVESGSEGLDKWYLVNNGHPNYHYAKIWVHFSPPLLKPGSPHFETKIELLRDRP